MMELDFDPEIGEIETFSQKYPDFLKNKLKYFLIYSLVLGFLLRFVVDLKSSLFSFVIFGWLRAIHGYGFYYPYHRIFTLWEDSSNIGIGISIILILTIFELISFAVFIYMLRVFVKKGNLKKNSPEILKVRENGTDKPMDFHELKFFTYIKYRHNGIAFYQILLFVYYSSLIFMLILYQIINLLILSKQFVPFLFIMILFLFICITVYFYFMHPFENISLDNFSSVLDSLLLIISILMIPPLGSLIVSFLSFSDHFLATLPLLILFLFVGLLIIKTLNSEHYILIDDNGTNKWFTNNSALN